MFMYCADCGQKLAPGARFCEDCGAPVEGAFSTTSPQPAAKPVQTASSPMPQVSKGWFAKRGKMFWIALAGMILLATQLVSLFSDQNNNNNTPFQQWLVKANPFYQQYFTVMGNFEAVNQNQQAARQQVTQAWEKLAQDLRGLQGQLHNLKPPPGVSKEDEADMVQLYSIWTELVAMELKMTEQMAQLSRSGQRPPAQFLRTTLPGMWQSRNKLMQDQQIVLTRLFSRHQVNAIGPVASPRL